MLLLESLEVFCKTVDTNTEEKQFHRGKECMSLAAVSGFVQILLR